MSVKISIAMATYNGDKYLREQLESFLAQTRLPDELVVCDDGSGDKTIRILEDFKASAPFKVHIYRNETRLNYIDNFNRALTLCTGGVIFLSDQDDVWFSNKVAVISELLILNCSSMVATNDQMITNINLTPTGHTTLENIRNLGLKDTWHSAGCCTAIKKEFLDVLLPIPKEVHGHDGWISSLADHLGVRIVTDVTLQFYRRHGDNTSDSIATQSGDKSHWDVIRKYGLSDVSEGWRHQICLHEVVCKRLKDRIDTFIRLKLHTSSELAIKNIRFQIHALNQRLAIVAKPRIRRFPDVFNLWARGYYKSFSGYKSALKDILR